MTPHEENSRASDLVSSAPRTGEIAREKATLRRDVRERRRARSPEESALVDRELHARLDALLADTGATFVACYLSTAGEPPTRSFIDEALTRGIRVLVPIARADGLLDWAEARADASHAPGIAGTPEPVGAELLPDALADVDLILVPAAAVDVSGARLGWGKGYYDRTIGTLTARPPVFAIIHDDELLPAVPRETHDEPVTGVVTPSRTLRFAPADHDR